MPVDAFRRRLREGPAVLYAILDTGVCVDPVADARALVDDGIDCLQVRAKDLPAREFLSLVERVLAAVDGAVPVLVNDRVDLAGLAGADGAHVGAEDLPAAAARRVLGPDRLLGLTVHSDTEVRAAPPDVDYLGAGAAFPTSTRKGAEIWGGAGLTGARALTTLPLVAVGGITPANVMELQGVGLAGVAVASAVTPVSLHPGAVAAFRRILDRW